MRADASRIGGGTRSRRATMPLAAWVALCVSCGVLAVLEFPPGGWLETLVRPAPAWPVRTLGLLFLALLALAAVGAWRIDRRRCPQRASALRLFLAQLGLSVVWVAVLFGGHAIGPALAIVAVLWLTLVATAIAFSRLDRVAALLVLPYLACTTFAFQQNIALWTLNV